MTVRDRKARVGQPHRFQWVSPAPVDSALAGDDRPGLVLRYSEGDSATIRLEPISDKVVIEAASGRTLTASAPVVAPGLAGRHGAAWLVADEDGPMAVRIVRVDGSSVTLANAPPRPLKAGLSAVLYWATWYGTIPSRATAARNVPLTVSYPSVADGPMDDPVGIDEGMIHWTPVPFSTGLTHDLLCRMRPEIADAVPDREQDFGGLLEDAEDELITEMRRQLAPLGLYEDDLVARPPALRLVHADLCCAHFFGLAGQAEAYRARAIGLLTEDGSRVGGMLSSAMQGVAISATHEGPPDSERTQVTGPRTSDAGGSFGTGFEADANTRRHAMGGRTIVAGAPR